MSASTAIPLRQFDDLATLSIGLVEHPNAPLAISAERGPRTARGPSFTAGRNDNDHAIAVNLNGRHPFNPCNPIRHSASPFLKAGKLARRFEKSTSSEKHRVDEQEGTPA